MERSNNFGRFSDSSYNNKNTSRMLNDPTFDTLRHSVLHDDETRLLEGIKNKRKEK